MPDSPGVAKQDELKDKEPITFSSKERKMMTYHFDRIKRAKKQRDSINYYFDGVDYVNDYYLNEEAKNSYLRPKMNDDEVRIVTGTTEKKIEVVLNELMQMNLQHEVRAFDLLDNELNELGESFTDIVTRTNEMENDESALFDIYSELLTQRAVFVEEIFVDKEINDSRRNRKNGKITKGMKKIQRCEKRVLPGLKVFLGDITIPMYRTKDQPFIVKYDRMLYWDVAAMFGKQKNWKYVFPGQPRAFTYDLPEAYTYRLSALGDEEVEVITYMSLPDDEYQIYINGVPMFEAGYPLPWEYDDYNIKGFCLKPLSPNCCYGKPLTASAKVLQALENESIRLLVRKFRQALEPPLGVKGNRVFSKDIWAPGSQVQGVTAGDFERLITHNGVTQSEMSMYDLIVRKSEEFIGQSSLQQGFAASKRMTAREIQELQKQAAKGIGLCVLEAMRVRKEMTLLRIYNVLENMTGAVDKSLDPFTKSIKDKFRTFTVGETKFADGTMGKKVISFSDKSLGQTEIEQMYDAEEQMKKAGENIRFYNINVDLLRSIPIQWYVSVSQKQKPGSDLDKVLFQDTLTQAAGIAQLTGRQLSPDRVIDDFQRINKIKDWFSKAPPQQMPGMGGEQIEGEGEIPPGSEAAQGMNKSVKSMARAGQPNINTLLAGAQ